MPPQFCLNKWRGECPYSAGEHPGRNRTRVEGTGGVCLGRFKSEMPDIYPSRDSCQMGS